MKSNSIPEIYSGFNPYYYSYYLLGLTQALDINGNKIIYSKNDFPSFLNRYFPFIYQNKRILVDAMDEPDINEKALSWCDLYGKVNYSDEYLPDNHNSKILPVGPSFSIKIWSLFPSLLIAIKNFLITWPYIEDTREFFANYYRPSTYRTRESNYSFQNPEKNYIFFVSSIWKKEKSTNNYRRDFIKVCRELNSINFEGGLIARSDVGGYEEYSIDVRYPIHDYIEKTKRSLLVFNTPAVEDCHGWKLGEYLALGKAIVSTPLSRKMPVEIEHGKHIHFVDGSMDSIENAIQRIQNDRLYQEHLQNNARKYYQDYLQPKTVILKLLNNYL